MSASIDFVTVSPYGVPDREALRRLLALQTPSIWGKIDFPKKKPGLDCITVHDPSPVEIQALLNVDPNAELRGIEFTLDFRPETEDPGEDELAPVFRWLSDCLAPVVPARPRRLQHDGRRYSPAPHDSRNPNLDTFRWEDRTQYVKYRLYMKKDDPRTTAFAPSVRLEVTFNRGGCQQQGLYHAWQLVEFLGNGRKKLAPFFYIARGIGFTPRRTDRYAVGSDALKRAIRSNEREAKKVENGWNQSGASWVVGKPAYRVLPNIEVHARIGKALDRLRTRHARLGLPEYSPGLKEPLSAKFIDLKANFPAGVVPSIGGVSVAGQGREVEV